MRARRLGMAAVVALSVAGGVVAGAVAFTPTAGIAQEDTDGTEDARTGSGCMGPIAPAAEAIGISEEALAEELRGGATIAEVAEANGVEVRTVIDAMVAAAEDRIDQAVEDGRLTEAEAAEKKAGLEERITALVNAEHPVLRMRHRMHERWRDRTEAEETVTS